MDSSQRDRAQEFLESALQKEGAPDPRDPCREMLRELRDRDPTAYEEALQHFDETLVPGIAEGELDPLDAWTAYAHRLAELSAPGRTVAIDATGRAVPYDPSRRGESLVIHLPNARSGRALLVALPKSPSPAQQASRDWLVEGRQKLPGA